MKRRENTISGCIPAKKQCAEDAKKLIISKEARKVINRGENYGKLF